MRFKNRSILILSVWLVGLFLAIAGCGGPAPSAAPKSDESLPPVVQEPAVDEVTETVEEEVPAQEVEPEPSTELSAAEKERLARQMLRERPVAEKVCYDLFKGDFTSASQELKTANPVEGGWLSRLDDIIEEYKAIDKHRLVTRREAYDELMDEYEKYLRSPDPNEANDITTVLLFVARAQRLAPPEQTGEDVLLSQRFIDTYVKKAVRMSEKYEEQGRWLRAYSQFYFLLTQIEEENEKFSDHAEELLERVHIKSSLQDSPCETRLQRDKGITKNMFIRSLRVLDLSHVSMMDYSLMASKALKRCRLLGEVLLFSDTFKKSDLSQPSAQAVAAWQASIQTLAYEVDTPSSGISISKDKFIALFQKVLSINTITIGLPEEVIISHFAEAALEAMDIHTNLVWPYQVQGFQKDMTHEFSGVGIEIRKESGQLKAVSLLPDTPAYRSGLDAGDIIEAVDGLSTDKMSLHCAVQKITGPRGTKVTLTIKRPGREKTENITITRDRIIVRTIRGWQRTPSGSWRYIIDPERKIGYVRIMSFVEKTADDLEDVLDELEAKGMNALIVDLRFNTGGHLSSAVEVCDKFLTRGVIVSTRPRYGVPIWESAHRRGTHPDYPLVVLVNEQSASASEIVAGALQDPVHKRAILVGTRTHGKGSVQTIIDYSGGGSQLKYTTAYYHLPSGQRVESREEAKKEGTENWGITPDVKVEIRPDEMQTMFDMQRDNDILVRADHDARSAPLSKSTLKQMLEADPQLAIAALIARAQLVEQEIEQTEDDEGGGLFMRVFNN